MQDTYARDPRTIPVSAGTLAPGVVVLGADTGALAAGLLEAGLGLARGPAAGMLVHDDPAASLDATIERLSAFAAACPPGAPALLVTLLPMAGTGLADWPAARLLAGLAAFTRAAALDWAKRDIRINAITLGPAAVPTRDVVRTLVAMRGLASMTGQMLRLGA